MDVNELKTEYRLSQWEEVIKEQQESGKTVAAFCSEKGISPKTYYYRLRKIRESICKSISQKQPVIAEIPLAVPEKATGGIRITTRKGTMDISEASPETLERLLRVMLHAE